MISRFKFIILALFLAALYACQDTETPPRKSDNVIIAGETPTDIKISSLGSEAEEENSSRDTGAGEYEKIIWEDLEIPGQGMEDIAKQFQDEIDAIPEGDPREVEVLERFQAALNKAPVNPKWNNRKIKLPGFITPLEIDDKEGIIKEFLLVPYFGACIHVPPPPLNQTLLVKPAPGKEVKLENSYDPIWVSGVIKADTTVTELAEAGYSIFEASIEPYEEALDAPVE